MAAMFRRRQQPSVRFSDEGIRRDLGRGQTEEVAWTALMAVEVMTTADGPGAEDVFFVLRGQPGGCVVPQSHMPTGLLERLQTLPGFDNEALIRAMASTEEASFVCWSAADQPK